MNRERMSQKMKDLHIYRSGRSECRSQDVAIGKQRAHGKSETKDARYMRRRAKISQNKCKVGEPITISKDGAGSAYWQLFAEQGWKTESDGTSRRLLGRRSSSPFVRHAHLPRPTQFAMLGLTISRRAIQVPTKRFATRSISRPTVSFRPRTSLAADSTSHRFRPSFNTPFTRCFHHETVSSSTPDTIEKSSEQKEVEKRGQDLSRYVLLNTCHWRDC